MIYLDYASTTPVCKTALDEMSAYFDLEFANPASTSTAGRRVFSKVEEAREIIAKSINASPEEIFFTSGATESNNWAIKHAVEALAMDGAGSSSVKKNHIITSKIEHSSVIQTCEYLKNLGYEVDFIEADEDGIVDVAKIEKSVKENTALISIMFANNEIGTLQPIHRICEIAKKHNILFHTDAVQAFGKEKIDVKASGFDMMSISSHKLYGPKGVGALYINKECRISPLLHGGGQERGMRSGTLNSPAIIGFGAAVKEYFEHREQIITREKQIVEKIKNRLLSTFPQIDINGSVEQRICNNLNISIPKIDHKKLLFLLDLEKIYVSAGSACSSGDIGISRVIEGLNQKNKREDIDGAIRISCSYLNTDAEIELFLESFERILKKMIQRQTSET